MAFQFQLSGLPTYHSVPAPDLSTATREFAQFHHVEGHRSGDDAMPSISVVTLLLCRSLRAFFENSYDTDETLFSGIIGLR